VKSAHLKTQKKKNIPTERDQHTEDAITFGSCLYSEPYHTSFIGDDLEARIHRKLSASLAMQGYISRNQR